MNEIEQWKKIVLTLPQASFFEITRNYLGELRTPFNKHSLINELVAFLRRPETQERIVLQIDEDDAKLLTALFLLDEPGGERLFSLFAGERSYLEFHNHLLNLEDRLLVYREADPAGFRVRVNPILRSRLAESAVRPELLFPSSPAKGPEPQAPWLSEALVLGFVSYLFERPGMLKSDGRPKKKIEDEMKAIFPGLLGATGHGSRLELLVRSLANLGFARLSGGELFVELERLRGAGRLDPSSLALLVWSAAIDDGEVAGDPEAFEERLAGFERQAQLIGDLLASLDPGRLYPLATLRRVALALAPERRGAEGDGPALPVGFDRLVGGLADLSVIVPSGKAGFRRTPSWPLEAPAAEPGGLVVQPSFSLACRPSLPFEAGLLVASIAEVRRLDVYPLYEITKRSFARALSRGLESGAICEALERSSGSPLPQNVRFSLESWQKEQSGIGLYAGVVLAADEERRILVEHSKAMKPWIRRVLAPGVFLLDPRERPEWEKALARSGLGPMPEVKQAGRPEIMRGTGRGLKTVAKGKRISLAPGGEAAPRAPGSPAQVGRRRDALLRELSSTLESLKLPRELTGELSARIRKKLILFPDQIRNATARQDRVEAKGLDYVGKVRLIEQALASGTDLLEILERSERGTTRKLLVRPEKVAKAGSDLLLHGRSLPEETAVQIKVRKIVLLRKLRSSLFAP